MSVLAIGGAAVVGGLLPWRRQIFAVLSKALDIRVPGGRVALDKTGLALMVSGGLGVAAFVGLGLAGGGVVTAGSQTGAFEYGAPNAPSIDALVFAPTADSLRVVLSAFVGSGDDTHDSTQIQVDTAGGDFASPNYHNVSLGAVLTDTVVALDSGSFVDVRARVKGANGGWSAWDTLAAVDMVYSTTGLVAAWNWSTGTGTSAAILRDTAKSVPWEAANLEDGETEILVVTAPSGFPAGMTNVLQLLAGPDEASTFANVYITSAASATLPTIGLGESIYYRWYYNLVDCTNAASEHFFHVAGNSLSVGSSVWYMEQECSGSTWGPSYKAEFTSFNNNRNDFQSSTTSLAQDSVYLFQVQLTRHATSDSTYYLSPYVFTITGDTILRPVNFAHGEWSLDEGFEIHTTKDMDVVLRSFSTGVNGLEVGVTQGDTIGYVGGIAICTTTWCGLFNASEESF